MDIINSILSFLHISPELGLAIVTLLLAVSEGLALIPALKSNSILQLITNTLKKIAGKA